MFLLGKIRVEVFRLFRLNWLDGLSLLYGFNWLNLLYGFLLEGSLRLFGSFLILRFLIFVVMSLLMRFLSLFELRLLWLFLFFLLLVKSLSGVRGIHRDINNSLSSNRASSTFYFGWLFLFSGCFFRFRGSSSSFRSFSLGLALIFS